MAAASSAAPAANAAVSLSDVSVAFRLADGGTYTAVERATLEVADGEFVAIVGPTGCGKSTLLNVAAGLLAPVAGSAKIFGNGLAGLNRQAGYLFQAESLFPWKTAIENVAIGLEIAGSPKSDSRKRAQDWLKRVGLAGFGDRYPHMLSGGQRKRVGLARALIDRPQILLYDEPTTGLDPVATKNVDEMIRRTADEFGVTSVVISHDMASTFRIGDRVAMLHAGQIIVDGTAKEVLASERPELREFIEISGLVPTRAKEARP